MATTKSEAKREIKRLVEKYELIKETRQSKKYDEANTRKDFIMPFFKALGWDVYSHFVDQEVVEEEEAITGRVDYSFRINNIPQFLLEAKALSVDLDKVEWAKQSLTYGWNKGIPWVILTNFEKLKLFSSEWLQEIPRPNLEFTYSEYLKRIDDLWLFSKQSIEKGELDQQASKWGIKAKRLKVSEKLAADLLKWRESLYKVLKPFNQDVSEEVINESVQRVLDRLIFVRACEDRGLEEKILWQTLKRWINKGRKPHNFMQELKPIFKKFDREYNSNLFQAHACERLDCYGEPFEKIIEDLYADKEKGVKYDFSVIPADVLGSIYEQYLGFVQMKGLINGLKRKKQGIYYTPSYIVDYIVQNTLGKVLKEKSLTEIENLKILDPACGSGSFLIKTFDLLDRALAKRRSQEKFGAKAAFRKYNILRNNIYGVDLDPQAIEIVRLNLLLKALEPKHKLPILSDNTKIGNSLISGTEKELKNYFGEKWQDKKPFNWKEEFPRVFKQGGFDIIIGNPPYVRSRNLDEKERDYFSKHFESAFRTFDIYLFFIEKSLDILKDKGIMGFIIPYSLLNQPYATKLRKLLLDKSSILEIVDLSSSRIFQDAVVSNCIICAQKRGRPFQVSITKPENNTLKVTGRLKQRSFLSNPDYMFKVELRGSARDLVSKIGKNSIPLSKVTYISKGIEVYERDSGKTKDEFISDSQRSKTHKPYLEAKEISRYQANWKGRYLFYQPEKHCSGKFPELFENQKIVMKRIIGTRGLTCYLDTENFYVENTLICCLLKKDLRIKFNFDREEIELSQKYNLRFLLAILNSKLMSSYFKIKFGDKLQIYNRAVGLLPIKVINFSNSQEKSRHKKIAFFADKMLSLNKDLQKCAEDSDKYRAIQAEIERADKKIDNLVYRLYNLTREEIKIVEKDL